MTAPNPPDALTPSPKLMAALCGPPPDAGVEERHRIEAVRSSFWNGEPPNWALDWSRTGEGQAPLAVTVHHAQSLANLEAAVRAEYAGVVERHATLVEAAQHVVDAPDADGRIAATFLLKHVLETLKNG